MIPNDEICECQIEDATPSRYRARDAADLAAHESHCRGRPVATLVCDFDGLVATAIIIAVPVAARAPETPNNFTGYVSSVVVADLRCNRIARHTNNRQCRGAGEKTCSAESNREHCVFDIH